MPSINITEGSLYTIPGSPPNLLNQVEGDSFASRNIYAMNIDFKKEPPMFRVSDTHYASTWLLHEKAPKVEMPEQLRARIKTMLEEAYPDGRKKTAAERD
jgi:oligopeptide transport system ATP-binding protein